MKFAVSNWIYGTEPLETSLERMKEYGYDGIELTGDPENTDTKKTRELLESYGIEPWGVVGIWEPQRDLINADKYVRKATIAYIKDCCKMISEIGGHIFSGLVPSTVGKIIPMSSAETEWKWAVECIRDIGKYAADVDVILAIEPLNRFETYFINRADQAVKLAEDVGLENVKVALDSFHLNIEEASLKDAIESSKGWMVDFHVADNNRRPPGEGLIDWKGILSNLKSIGYDDYLVMEYLTPLDRSPLALSSGEVEEDDKALLDYMRAHGTGRLTGEYYNRSTENSIIFLKSLL